MENMEELKNKTPVVGQSTLRGKAILVTGGAGFIGSHLVDALLGQNCKVVVVDNLFSGRKENINPKAKFYKTDVRNRDIFEILKKEKIEIVFHLAAQPIVDKAYENPFEAIEINVMGTVNVLEACKKKGGLESIVVVSSDKAYGKAKELPYKEHSPLRGDHPYDASKSAADLIAQTYFSTYGLPVIITRFSNVFGPRDFNFSRIIPGALEAIIKNKELLIRSDGKMIREYTYVKDIVNGCIKLAQKTSEVKGGAFNFGSKNIFAVMDVVKKIEEILGVKIKYKILNITKNEIPEQYLDWTKAREILDWQPKTSFEEGIKKTFSWYKRYIVQ